MSDGHCTHPTGGPAIRLKHKKTYLTLFKHFCQATLCGFGCDQLWECFTIITSCRSPTCGFVSIGFGFCGLFFVG